MQYYDILIELSKFFLLRAEVCPIITSLITFLPKTVTFAILKSIVAY